jgi:dCTP deaminase
VVINGKLLVAQAPIVNMLTTKEREHGVSHGLSEVGYDIRVKQDIRFKENRYGTSIILDHQVNNGFWVPGRFCIASAMEEFQMPTNLVGIVHDKSTWARRGLSVFNTVIEPGWNGFLTLELVYHGQEPLHIPAGAGIAQVVFHELNTRAQYEGKYQNQADKPVAAIHES